MLLLAHYALPTYHSTMSSDAAHDCLISVELDATSPIRLQAVPATRIPIDDADYNTPAASEGVIFDQLPRPTEVVMDRLDIAIVPCEEMYLVHSSLF